MSSQQQAVRNDGNNQKQGIHQNPIRDKSFLFAVRIVRLHRYLSQRRKEYVLSRQLLRCGTSIGANVAEAQSAISRPDFSCKISVSYKEARETAYWLDLLYATELITGAQFDSMKRDCDELCKLLFAILKTTRLKRLSQTT